MSHVQPLVEHRPVLAGVRTRALELEGSGPPLVLLHGYADSADTWRLVLDRLARRDRRAIALDLPGFASADPLKPEGTMLGQLDAFAAAAVEYAREESGGEDPVVVGNSLGGVVGLRAAQDPALGLRAVVPVAPAGFDMPGWFGAIERDPFVRALLASPIPLPEVVVRRAVGLAFRQLAFGSRAAATGAVVSAFTAHHRDKASVARYLANGRRLLPELAGCFSLERITCPVLLLWGDRDRMVTHRGARHVTRALPRTRSVVYTGVGHCPQLEVPDRLVEDVEGFLAKVATQAAA